MHMHVICFQLTNQNETIISAIQATEEEEEEEVLPAVDVKEEEGNKPSCSSVHLGGWSGTLDGEYCAVSPRSIVFFAY